MMDEDEENQFPVKPAPKKNGVNDDSDEADRLEDIVNKMFDR